MFKIPLKFHSVIQTDIHGSDRKIVGKKKIETRNCVFLSCLIMFLNVKELLA